MTIDEELKARLNAYILDKLNEKGLFEQKQKCQIGIMIWDTRNI